MFWPASPWAGFFFDTIPMPMPEKAHVHVKRRVLAYYLGTFENS